MWNKKNDNFEEQHASQKASFQPKNIINRFHSFIVQKQLYIYILNNLPYYGIFLNAYSTDNDWNAQRDC